MTFSTDTWRRIAPVRDAIYAHPFVTGLGDGSLAGDRFAEYMVQDALYLADYGRVLAALAMSSHDPDDLVFWASGARETILVERQLHASHVAVLDAAEPSPTCRAYTSYLLSLVLGGSYAVAAAGVLPCYWIYADVGKRLLSGAGELAEHPYGDWIGLYADDAFDAQVEQAKSIVDRLAAGAGPDEVERMHQAFATATRYEWMFWDAAWRLETWPV